MDNRPKSTIWTLGQRQEDSHIQLGPNKSFPGTQEAYKPINLALIRIFSEKINTIDGAKWANLGSKMAIFGPVGKYF